MTTVIERVRGAETVAITYRNESGASSDIRRIIGCRATRATVTSDSDVRAHVEKHSTLILEPEGDWGAQLTGLETIANMQVYMCAGRTRDACW